MTKNLIQNKKSSTIKCYFNRSHFIILNSEMAFFVAGPPFYYERIAYEKSFKNGKLRSIT